MPRKRRHPKKNPHKPGVSGARYRKDAVFKNSRRAATEFGQAAQSAVLVRREMMSMLEGASQYEMHKKLTKRIAALIREKRSSGITQVSLNDINWEQFEGLLFNPEATLINLLFDRTDITVDPSAGKITITHPSFKVTDKVKPHKSITHMRIIAGAVAIDFDRKTTSHDYTATDYLPWHVPDETTISLAMELPAPIVHPLFVVIGLLGFKQETDKKMYEMPNRRYRALNIVYVKPAPPPPAGKPKRTTPIKPRVGPKPPTKTIKKASPDKKKRK